MHAFRNFLLVSSKIKLWKIWFIDLLRQSKDAAEVSKFETVDINEKVEILVYNHVTDVRGHVTLDLWLNQVIS